jgi:hypothetical protein
MLLWCFVPFFGGAIQAQTDRERVIIAAMTDELQRNVDSLHIAGWERPFFIQYAIQDGAIFQVQATMGALTGVNEFPLSNMSVQTLVGNYEMSNLNYASSDYRTGSSSDSSPLDDNYSEMRRRLWLLTDQAYKKAIEAYSAKLAAVKRQNLPEEVLKLPDFTRLPAVNYWGAGQPVHNDHEYWKQLARECSAVFAKYPKIFASNVGIEVYVGNIYSRNNEGTQLKHSVRLITVAVNAYTKLDDGEEISDRLTYYGRSRADLPEKKQITEDVDKMAAAIIALSVAPAMEESYTGPVMIEGQALASAMVSGLLSPQTGLIAYRTPIHSGGVQKSMEDRINRKILSSDIIVKSVPQLTEYDGQRLIGAYETDAEGITPKELLLVENGMLRTLMCDRIPKKKVKTPTGNRVYVYQPQNVSTSVSPGVLTIQTLQGLTPEALKEKLLATAKEEGLEYAYIIRSLPNGRNAAIYKIRVADGREEPVRAGVLADISLAKLKRALGISADSKVANMIAGSVPLSVIYPAAMVIEEMDIEKRNLQNTTKLPTVSNPLANF